MAKKIGIISDTHGLLRPEVLEILKTCDCILHAGDVDRPELLDRLRCLGSIYVAKNSSDLLESRAIMKESDIASSVMQTVMLRRPHQEKLLMFIT